MVCPLLITTLASIFLSPTLSSTTFSTPTSSSTSHSITTSSHSITKSSPTSHSTHTSPSLNLWAHLPSDWSTFCNVDYDVDHDVNATITCQVTPHDPVQWRLDDLRQALGTLVESTGLEVAVDLQCETGGTISLPFPMRAPGLAKLTVFNCRLLDKYADFNTSAEKLGDWMRVQNMRDCVWLNDPQDLERLLANSESISSHYDCGQDSTLVSYIYRNISDMDLREGEGGGGGGGDGERVEKKGEEVGKIHATRC